uniref:Uncharacterized protein n=1 Tax=Candidatus Kentrum sp. SD TaxID=2126332 RepID=A0A450Y4W4_9GAMM|nr:MAG: hypothetical protein BECKSD772F_GA0070984_100314 [Candidatus Kentron sp. SD]VFK39633.1 MAG: hypothetical protein BECKSD772E_GA0070983_100358 [Candidatus Kentron sp. SD]VFK78059.1 MAG: hypothetical protein BECKSD772D_GA0070982_100614 [Candidatus Kentron sp. SD]
MFPVHFDPGLHQFQLGTWQVAAQYGAIVDGDGGFVFMYRKNKDSEKTGARARNIPLEIIATR